MLSLKPTTDSPLQKIVFFNQPFAVEIFLIQETFLFAKKQWPTPFRFRTINDSPFVFHPPLLYTRHSLGRRTGA